MNLLGFHKEVSSFIGIYHIFVLPPLRLSNMPEDHWTFRINCCTNTYLFSRAPFDQHTPHDHAFVSHYSSIIYFS